MGFFCNAYAVNRARGKGLKSCCVLCAVTVNRHVGAIAVDARTAGVKWREPIVGGGTMSITSSSLPFTEMLVAAAPEAPGVFALWQGGGIVYYGRTATIRIA